MHLQESIDRLQSKEILEINREKEEQDVISL